MALTDLASNAIRNVLRLFEDAGAQVEQHSPIEGHLHDAVAALHRTADSMDRHVEVLETVAAALPGLVEVLGRLSDELGEVLTALRPVEAAEHELSGISHLFRRHRHEGDAEPAKPE